jgi:hypothetical protein
MQKLHYLIHVKGGVEPHIKGPYANEKFQSRYAKSIHKEISDEDALFWLDVGEDGVPLIGSYAGGFFE